MVSVRGTKEVPKNLGKGTEMTATRDFQTALEAMTAAELREEGKDWGITFGNRAKRDDMISQIITAKADRDRAEAMKKNEEVSVLAAFKDHPENAVPVLGKMTREEMEARIARARQSSAEAEALRKQAEAARPKNQAWEPTVDEFVKRYNRVGYAMGGLIGSLHKLNKGIRVAGEVADAMGELFDREACELAKEAMIEGFVRNWDTFNFPSKAIRGMRGEAMKAGIWAEMQAAYPAIPLFALLDGDDALPVMEPTEDEEGGEEEE